MYLAIAAIAEPKDPSEEAKKRLREIKLKLQSEQNNPGGGCFPGRTAARARYHYDKLQINQAHHIAPSITELPLPARSREDAKAISRVRRMYRNYDFSKRTINFHWNSDMAS